MALTQPLVRAQLKATTKAVLQAYAGMDGQFVFCKEDKHMYVMSGTAGQYTQIANMSDVEGLVSGDLVNYVKKTELTETLADYATTTALTSGLAAKADASAISDMLTKTEAASTYAKAADVYTKGEVDGKLTSAMHYKGTVANQGALPSDDVAVGDVYNVIDTGNNFAWDGSKWDQLSGVVDLSAYETKANATATYATKEQLGGYLPTTGGTVSGDLVITGQLTATASQAAQLATARSFSITGGVTAAAKTFNGTADVQLEVTAVDGSVVTGTVPQAAADGNGNNIASTYVTLAAINAAIDYGTLSE